MPNTLHSWLHLVFDSNNFDRLFITISFYCPQHELLQLKVKVFWRFRESILPGHNNEYSASDTEYNTVFHPNNSSPRRCWAGDSRTSGGRLWRSSKACNFNRHHWPSNHHTSSDRRKSSAEKKDCYTYPQAKMGLIFFPSTVSLFYVTSHNSDITSLNKMTGPALGMTTPTSVFPTIRPVTTTTTTIRPVTTNTTTEPLLPGLIPIIVSVFCLLSWGLFIIDVPVKLVQ